MKVSVVLPAYRHEQFVGPAIESVLSQSFSDFELLIGDDASPDGTVDVIRSYQDPRIRFFPHHINYGATFNHRFLLERAQGEYVALINSDDLWLPGKLEKQVRYLDEHPEVVMCSCWAKFIDENGEDLYIADNVFEQPNRTQEEWIEYFFLHGNCICHPGVLIRREVYERLNYYHLALRQLPDFEMWVRMIREGEFYIFQEPLVAHRRFIGKGENTSTPKIENSIRDVMESYYVLSEYLEDLPDDLFCRTFRKHFQNQRASTAVELRCERFFLLASGRYYMGEIYKQAAVMYFFRHYDMEMAKVLREQYQYMLSDFYQLSCQVNLLGLIAPEKQEEGPDKHEETAHGNMLPSQEDMIEHYIRSNWLRVLGILLFRKGTWCYRFASKIYRAFKGKKSE